LQQPSRLVVTFVNDPVYFFVDSACCEFAEGLGLSYSRTEIGIDLWRELDHAKPVAHPPSGNHTTCDFGSLNDIVLCTGRTRAVHHLFCRATTEDADDSRAKVFLRIVVSVAIGTLMSNSEGHAPWYDAHPVHGVRTGDDESEYGMSAFVVSDAFAVFGTQQQRTLWSED